MDTYPQVADLQNTRKQSALHVCLESNALECYQTLIRCRCPSLDIRAEDLFGQLPVTCWKRVMEQKREASSLGWRAPPQTAPVSPTRSSERWFSPPSRSPTTRPAPSLLPTPFPHYFPHSPAGETPARAGGARARAALGGEGRQSARSLAAGPRGVPNRGGDGADARHSARPRRQLRDETRRRVPEIEGFPGLAGSSSKKTAWSRWTSTRRSARRAFCRRGARRRRSARRWTSSTRPLWRARKSGTCSAWSGRRDTTSGPTGR